MPNAWPRIPRIRSWGQSAHADAETAQEIVTEGVGADEALITVGVVTEEVIAAALAAIRKRGTVVITGLAGRGRRPSCCPASS